MHVMLWVFIKEANLRTAVMPQFYRSQAQVATNHGQATGQHQPRDQAHKGLAGQFQRQPASYPQAEEHHRQQAGSEQLQAAVGVDPGDQEQRQAHHRAATDQRTLGSPHLLLYLQPRAQVDGAEEAAATEQCAEQAADGARWYFPIASERAAAGLGICSGLEIERRLRSASRDKPT